MSTFIVGVRITALLAYSAAALFAQQSRDVAYAPSTNEVGDLQSQFAVVPAASTAKTVAYCQGICTGFSISTRSIYYTSYLSDEFVPDAASFHRTSKTSSTGGETLVYQETPAGEGRFGRPVRALVNGVSYGYFGARYDTGTPTYQMKRVSLDGGDATVLAYLSSPVNSIETDETRLYWSDSSGIRSMPLQGGVIQNLLSIHGSGRIGIRVDSNYLYYSFGREIRRMPKSGGPASAVVTAPDIVTTFHVSGDLLTTIFWGEQGGAVRAFNSSGTTTYQNPVAGRSATQVGFDGTRVLWVDCANSGPWSCVIKSKTGNFRPAIVFTGGAVANLQWDAASLYWHDTSSIRRFDH